MTARYGLAHGAALALVLPRVLEWSVEGSDDSRLREIVADLDLPALLRKLAQRAELPGSLRDAGIPEGALPRLAEEAAAQWTGKFSPRKFDPDAALEIYRAAYA